MAVPPADFRPQKSAVMMQTPSGSPWRLSASARAPSSCAALYRNPRGGGSLESGPLRIPLKFIKDTPERAQGRVIAGRSCAEPETLAWTPRHVGQKVANQALIHGALYPGLWIRKIVRPPNCESHVLLPESLV